MSSDHSDSDSPLHDHEDALRECTLKFYNDLKQSKSDMILDTSFTKRANEVNQEMDEIKSQAENCINGNTFPEEERGELIAKLHIYLDERSENWSDPLSLPPTYLTLRKMMTDDRYLSVRKSYLKRICSSVDQQKYEDFMNGIPRGDRVPENKFDFETFKYIKDTLMKWFGKLGIGGGVFYSCIDELVDYLTSMSFKDVARNAGIAYGCCVAVSGVYNFVLCKSGRRSSARAWKNLMDDAGAIFVGQLVGLGAVALIPCTGGLSLVIGAIAGGIATFFTYAGLDKYTCKLKNIPQDEAYEQALSTLGCKVDDTLGTIGKAYLGKSMLFHPDKFEEKFKQINPLARRDKKTVEEESFRNLIEFLKIQTALLMVVAKDQKDDGTYKFAREDFLCLLKEGHKMNGSLLSKLEKVWGWIGEKFLKWNWYNTPLPDHEIISYEIFQTALENVLGQDENGNNT